jgi:hypothetical protein
MAEELDWAPVRRTALAEPRAERGAAPSGRRPWVARLLGVGGRAGPTSAALWLGVLAAAAFAASMSYEWYSATTPLNRFDDVPGEDGVTLSVSIASLDLLGVVYVVGGIGLLTAIGAIAAQPVRGERLRLPVTGGAAGVLAVVVAISLRAHASVLQSVGGGLLVPEAPLHATYRPGIYLGYVTVGLAVAAVWLAAPLRRRSAPAPSVEESTATGAPAWAQVVSPVPRPARSGDEVRELTVRASGSVEPPGMSRDAGPR